MKGATFIGTSVGGYGVGGMRGARGGKSYMGDMYGGGRYMEKPSGGGMCEGIRKR